MNDLHSLLSTLNPTPEQPISAQEAMSRPLLVVLVVVGAFLAFARKVDRAMATVALFPTIGFLIGSGSDEGLRSAAELLTAAVIGGIFLGLGLLRFRSVAARSA